MGYPLHGSSPKMMLGIPQPKALYGPHGGSQWPHLTWGKPLAFLRHLRMKEEKGDKETCSSYDSICPWTLSSLELGSLSFDFWVLSIRHLPLESKPMMSLQLEFFSPKSDGYVL